MMIADARLGLTATPSRDAGVVVASPTRRTTVFEPAVADLGRGFLASFDSITLYLDLTSEERSAYMGLAALFTSAHAEFRQLAPNGSWADFTHHAARTPEGRRALSAWRQMRRLLAFTHAKRRALESLLGRHRHSRVLIFTADNETAYAIAREHLVMPLTCDISRPERDDVLERFRHGDLRTLVSARVLNEGLDVPDADVAVVVGGALGEREHVQRVGRLLRPSEGKRAVVTTCYAEHPRSRSGAPQTPRSRCPPICSAIAWPGRSRSLITSESMTTLGCELSSTSMNGSLNGRGASWRRGCANRCHARARRRSSDLPSRFRETPAPRAEVGGAAPAGASACLR